MSLPVRVRCTDERGEVVHVTLVAGWLWQQVSFEGHRYTAIFVPNVSTVEITDDTGRCQVVMPGRQLVRQTPDELKALEREAYKSALREELAIRRELEVERTPPPPAPKPQPSYTKP